MEKSAEPKSRKLWHKLLTIRGVVAGTALATLVTWGVTELVTYLQHKVTAPDPVSWTVETNPNRVGGLSDLPINLTLPIGAHPSTGPGAGCINFRDWARNNGGVDAGATHLQVVLQAHTPGDLQIQDARAVIVRQDPPMAGIGVSCPTAGETEFRSLKINLDKPDTRARYESPTRHPFGFTLKQGEAETFLVTATAGRGSYAWYLELTIIADHTSRTVRIDDHGRDFHTTTAARGASWKWDYQNSWYGPKDIRVPAGGKLD